MYWSCQSLLVRILLYHVGLISCNIPRDKTKISTVIFNHVQMLSGIMLDSKKEKVNNYLKVIRRERYTKINFFKDYTTELSSVKSLGFEHRSIEHDNQTSSIEIRYGFFFWRLRLYHLCGSLHLSCRIYLLWKSTFWEMLQWIKRMFLVQKRSLRNDNK